MSTRTLGLTGAAVIVAIIAVVALVAGGGDEAQAQETDGAFVAGMVPHHESAIEMAEIAQQRAEHPEIRTLAADIISTQSSEIKTLDSIHERLYGEPVGELSHGSLGIAEYEMGMSGDVSMLETAKPFDRAFIDMMIPHHQGAIRIARVELAEGEDEEAMELATAIIDAQSREIEGMNEWREEWFGAPSPAGGVPPEEELAPAGGMEGMQH